MSIGSPNTLPTFLALALACMVGVLAWAAPAAAQRKEKKPVVVVIFDEFSTASLLDRTGKRIHKERFPNFHRLSKQGAWYPKHTTVADFTTRAVPAILTGKQGKPTFADYRQHPNSIYSLLGGAGYRFRNLEIYTQLCPPLYCDPPGERFLDPYPSDTPGSFGRRILEASNQKRRMQDWVKKLRGLGSGHAAVAHILLPHSPHRFLPNGQTYDYEAFQSLFRSDPSLSDFRYRRMLFQVGYVDFLLGRIVNSIKKSDQWKETMLVVAGDHGVSLRPGLPARRVVSQNRHEIGLTPLLVKYPDRRSVGRREAMTQSIDILPTIADALGIDQSYPTDGRPIRSVPRDRLVGARDVKGSFFPINRSSAAEWLARSARTQALSQGNRGLEALGPVSRAIGKRALRTKLTGSRKLSIADLESLKKAPRSGQSPALVQGYVRSGPGGPSVGSRLLLALDGRFVASTSVHTSSGRSAFAFLIHPKYLGNRGLGKVTVFQVSRSGKKVRIF